MDSPKPSSKTATINSTINPTPAEDSPVFSYISNLSPIQPVKAAPVVQGFPGLNSPPLLFTSPRVSAHSRLRRSQFPQLSSEVFSGKNEDYNNAITHSDGNGVSVSQLRSELSPSVQKVSDNNISVPDESGSPIRCVDEFLVDVSNSESANPSNSTNPSPKVADNIPQSPNSAAESVADFASKDARKDEIPKDAARVVVEQAEEENRGKSSSDQKDNGIYNTSTDSDLPSPDLCTKIEPDLPADNSLHYYHYRAPQMAQLSRADHAMLDEASDIQTEPLENAHDCRNDNDKINSMSSAPDECIVQHDSQTKAGQYQSGIRRRCLQFEDAQRKISPTSVGSQNASDVVSCSIPPVSPAVIEVVASGSSNRSSTASSRPSTQLTSSSDNSGSFAVKVPKPSGIGLHLNSIAMQAGSRATVSVKSAERGNLSISGKKLMSMMSCHPSENLKSCSISSNVVGSHLTIGDNDGKHESYGTNAESAASLHLNTAKPLNNTVLLKPTEHTISHKRKSSSEYIDSPMNYNQSSPKKKRKKPSDAYDGDGCKRCNCKKSKCLKLYCDCFAAGIYCAGSCACQGCFNRLEYEDTVNDVRQQIQSRNPLAFCPKVVQHPTDSPASILGAEGASFTPPSARHKRGCSCKKSMCLKKYCECYQANVGCSSGCRCEGCKNVYGLKEEYGKDLVKKHCITERLEKSVEEKVEMVTATSGLLQIDPRNQCNLTPPTPSFQCSNHGKNASKSWFTSGRYLSSPESGQAIYGLSPASPTSSKNHDIDQETTGDIMDLVTFDQEFNYGNAKLENEFSPGFHVTDNTDDLLALPKSQDLASNTGGQLIPQTVHFQSTWPLSWRDSPMAITPINQFDGSGMNAQELLNSGKKPYAMEDDTPEILKDSSMPQTGVKVSSPNKKRISPPNRHLNELGSSSSGGGLKTGRKFILRAVPSFPPLTPCIDSKDVATHSADNSQKGGRDK